MNFVLLQSFPNYIDAYIVMGRLEEEDIRCWLKDENTVTIDPILTNAVGGIKLMVQQEQAERALELIQEIEAKKKSRMTCPRCGSHDIELISTPRKAMNWISSFTTFLFGHYPIAVDHVYHCFKCSAEFKEPAAGANEQ